MKWIVLAFKWIARCYFHLLEAIRRFDRSMRNQYRPARLALVALLIIAALMTYMLLLPPYLGLSNDGSLDTVLVDVGLSRINPESTEAYFSYYERTYYIEDNAMPPGVTPMLLKVMARLAIGLDTLLTGDTLFDMRFLAGLYMAIYLALLYPLLYNMLRRVPRYSEGLLLAAASVLVFADSTLVVRFASLYTSPLEALALLCVADVLFLLPGGKQTGLSLVMLAAGVLALTNVNRYCALLGIVAAVICWRVFTERKDLPLRMLSFVTALLLIVCSVMYTGVMLDRQTRTAKYNQMTRGVLFQADDPTRALEFFGIEPRYSVLTDTYGDQEYPVVLPEDGVLDEGFFDRYSTVDVLRYYLSHPVSLLGMFDRGVYQAFITRSDYSGNYEQSVGLPPMAKTPFMSVWSTFKAQSAPKTAGMVLLLGVVLLIRKKQLNREDERWEARYKELIGLLIVMAVLEILTVLVMSGDSELLRESFLMGMTIDVLVVLFITEMLNRTKNIELDEE